MTMALKAPSGPTPPPKKAAPAKPAAVSTAAAAEAREARIEGRMQAAQGVLQLASMGFLMKGQLADVGNIAKNGPGFAAAAAETAEDNEYLAKGLDFLGMVGPYGALLMAGLPLIGQFLVNRGVVPAHMLAGAGCVTPETLEAEAKVILLRQQAEAQAAAQQAEREFQELMAQQQRLQQEGARQHEYAHAS